MEVCKVIPKTLRQVTQSQSGEATPMNIEVTAYFKKAMEELISAGTRCVTIFDNVSDYKWSTLSSEYYKVSPVDVAGSIKRIDWDTLTVWMEIDDKYQTEGSAFYIPEEDWDKYQLVIRARTEIGYRKELSGATTKYVTITQLFGLDLVGMKFSKTEETENESN